MTNYVEEIAQIIVERKERKNRNKESAQVVVSKICKLLTTEEVAEILQLDPNMVRRYLHKGKLVGIRLGLTWRVELEDLRKFLDGQKTKEAK